VGAPRLELPRTDVASTPASSPAADGLRTNSVGIPAAPPANGPGARFTPPAPPAHYLTPFGEARPPGPPLAASDDGQTSRVLAPGDRPETAPLTPPGDAPVRHLPPFASAPARHLPARGDAFARHLPPIGGAPPPPLPPPAGASTGPPAPADAPPPPLPPPGNALTRPLPSAGSLPARGLPPTGNGPTDSPLPSGDGAPARPLPTGNGSGARLLSPAADSPTVPPPDGRQPDGGTASAPTRLQSAPGPGVSVPPALAPGAPGTNGRSPTGPRRTPGEGGGRPPGAPHPGEGTTGWRPLPEPALATPQRPAPARTVGRLASLAPDPEPKAAMRPAPTPPRTAQDFAPERVTGPVKDRPATRGLRRAVHAISFGIITPGPSRSERHERDLIATAMTPIGTCRRVAIVSRKGGIGKTTTTLMLGHTFATHRRDRVVALDANPDAGSLAYRVHRETDATITQLLRASERIRRYSDMRNFTNQSPTRLEVLASDDDPTISVALGEPEYRQVLHVLEHHYNLILMDTGTGILDSATQGILRIADQIVVCAAPGIDASRASSLTLDWLDEHGYHDLVSDAVVVINQVRKRHSRELQSVVDHFAKRCRAVVKVPWDPHLAEGFEVDVEDLRPATSTAYLTAVAAVARSFGLPSHRH